MFYKNTRLREDRVMDKKQIDKAFEKWLTVKKDTLIAMVPPHLKSIIVVYLRTLGVGYTAGYKQLASEILKEIEAGDSADFESTVIIIKELVDTELNKLRRASR